MKSPEVSVVIPFYSEKNWLIEAIDSVLAQTYSNLEIIVVNDGSPVDINDLIEKYGERVKFIKKENGGPSTARNLGIKKSRGKYIAFLDSDDIWHEDKLKHQVNLMNKNNSIWSQHSYEMFDGNKTKYVDTSMYQGNVIRDCYISFKVQTSTIMVLREVLISDSIFFPTNQRYGQDVTFYKSLASKYNLDFVEGALSKFRIRGSNAGFRAVVQLQNRSDVWEELENKPDILNLLPFSVILAYRFSNFNYKLYKKIAKSKNNESLAKFLYIVPYLLFKTAKG